LPRALAGVVRGEHPSAPVTAGAILLLGGSWSSPAHPVADHLEWGRGTTSGDATPLARSSLDGCRGMPE
jgi:hypothetical protein